MTPTPPKPVPLATINQAMTGVTPHHVGCAVRDLESSCSLYADCFARRRTHPFMVESQGVSVVFVELAPHFYLELVNAESDVARLGPYLKTGFYHLCFLVDCLESARAGLKARGFSALPSFSSEAFDGAACQFLINSEHQLIELAEMSPSRFDTFFATHQSTNQCP